METKSYKYILLYCSTVHIQTIRQPKIRDNTPNEQDPFWGSFSDTHIYLL